MSESLKPPAETYKLNALASALGRFAIPDLDNLTRGQASDILDLAIDDLETKDVPPVPHTNPALLGEATKFDNRLLWQVENGKAAHLLADYQKQAISKKLSEHTAFCHKALEKNAQWEMLSNPRDVADAYRLPDLFKNPHVVISEEVQKWGKATQHPEILLPLKSKVSAKETSDILHFMWSRVVGISPSQSTNIYLTNNPDDYHLYWTPTFTGLDYATPADYDRATQLSFDAPHNAAHLAHLDALGTEAGAERYQDSMPQRAYFEAVAVLSEHACVELALADKEFGRTLAELYGLEAASWGSSMGEWVAKDRAYEFKLRAVRYAADILMMDGVDLNETVYGISDVFKVPRAEVEKEVRKYLPWTGLGATYTHGYRKLLDNGVRSVSDAIYLPSGQVKTSWS